MVDGSVSGRWTGRLCPWTTSAFTVRTLGVRERIGRPRMARNGAAETTGAIKPWGGWTMNDKPKPLSRIQQRLIESAAAIEADDPEMIIFQHSLFCQLSLPHRDPGPDTRTWVRHQGGAMLVVEAGKALHPDTGAVTELGLPFGPPPRLTLVYLNREALIYGSPEIEVGQSLTAFVRRLQGFVPNGAQICLFKDQLSRLAASTVRLAARLPDREVQVNTQIIGAFDLWLHKDERQRVLWPSTVRLSLDYFESLQKHAVPLDERAIAALKHSATGLDTYCWLAQRLHRVKPGKPQFIPWAAIKTQFGSGYERMNHFKPVFRKALEAVLTQYRAARVELDHRGLTLRHSPPPVKGRVFLLASSKDG